MFKKFVYKKINLLNFIIVLLFILTTVSCSVRNNINKEVTSETATQQEELLPLRNDVSHFTAKDWIAAYNSKMIYEAKLVFPAETDDSVSYYFTNNKLNIRITEDKKSNQLTHIDISCDSELTDEDITNIIYPCDPYLYNDEITKICKTLKTSNIITINGITYFSYPNTSDKGFSLVIFREDK